MSISDLEAEALKLSPEDQARLLHRLAVALDATEETDLTNEELERRWVDFESGKVPGVEAAALRERALRRYGLS
jgi:putative addiction module component (TIGR02574 family)